MFKNWWSETLGRLDKHQNLRRTLCAQNLGIPRWLVKFYVLENYDIKIIDS